MVCRSTPRAPLLCSLVTHTPDNSQISIYYEATQINSTLTNTVVGSAVAGQCGADFGKSEPTDVTVQKPGAASGAVPGETTTSLKNGALSYSLAPFAVVGASVVAVFIGAASVF